MRTAPTLNHSSRWQADPIVVVEKKETVRPKRALTIKLPDGTHKKEFKLSRREAVIHVHSAAFSSVWGKET